MFLKNFKWISLIHNTKLYIVERVFEPDYFYKIYENNEILVINKRFCLVVHPSKSNIKGTLVNAILSYKKTDFINLPRAGLVHRIDKDTSGLLIIAKNLVSYRDLKTKIKEKSIIREYDVVVIGQLDIGGYINSQIGRNIKYRNKKNIVNDEGKIAITHFRVLERFNTHTYLRCWLETGRTHQIRVHMQSISRAVIGDELYLNNKILPNLNIRQALHAHCLILKHPSKQIYIKLLAKLPKDMTLLLALLRTNKIHTISHTL
ncbi:RluA family pseudouridine synthase [Candidatus Portiera aleyrodidarum]|uniref:RluA family pseudouridine synthase n=1 Tax=Candidatus Portiera aleyrodidarum TaxID=91844 RepID=UPI0020B17481|nr:RluA family pseudouridine synthase [Candidatus Portiera aleyrodidarum]